jgi:hypothetical protein
VRQGLALSGRAARLSREEFERLYGERLWERDLDKFHHVTKVEPMERALKDVGGGITGRRRDQASSRTDMPVVEIGERIKRSTTAGTRAWVTSRSPCRCSKARTSTPVAGVVRAASSAQAPDQRAAFGPSAPVRSPCGREGRGFVREVEVEEDGGDDGRIGQEREDPHLGAATHASRGCPGHRSGSDPVVVVSSSLARRYYGDTDPVGRRMLFNSATWVRIVGVTEDVRYRDLTSDPMANDDPDVYLAYYRDFPSRNVGFVVRVSGEAAPAVPLIRRTAEASLAGVPVQSFAPLSDGVRNATALSRFGSILFATFGTLAGILAPSASTASSPCRSGSAGRRSRSVWPSGPESARCSPWS